MKINIGDYFSIPLKDGSFGVGYIIDRAPPAFYIGALAQRFEALESFNPSLLKDPSNFGFFGNFLNAKLKNGDWEILGNLEPEPDSFPILLQKIKIGDKYIIENYSKEYVRDATADDLLLFDNPTNRAPMILQNAINAAHGLHEPDIKYDKVSARYVLDRSQFGAQDGWAQNG